MNYLKKLISFIRNLIIFLLLILMVIFMVSNRQIIEIDFSPLPFTASLRIFTLMISCFAFGFVVAIIVLSQKFVKNFFNNYRNQRKIKKLQKQISFQQHS